MPDLKRTQFDIDGQSISIEIDLHDVIVTVVDRDGVSASCSVDPATAHAIANIINLQSICAEANK